MSVRRSKREGAGDRDGGPSPAARPPGPPPATSQQVTHDDNNGCIAEGVRGREGEKKGGKEGEGGKEGGRETECKSLNFFPKRLCHLCRFSPTNF